MRPYHAIVTDDPWTTRRLLAWIRSHLAEREVDSPRVCAELLVSAAIGAERLRLYMEPDRPATDAERRLLRDWVRRAGEHEPVQYLVGEAWFHGLRFEVDASTLIPRPSSETLVEVAAERLRGIHHPVRILEPCTGTGCVGVALLRLLDRPHRAASRLREADEAIRADVARLVAATGGELEEDGADGDPAEITVLPGELASLVATELVPAAAGLAGRNIAAHGLGDRAEVRVGSLYQPLADREQATFDLIVANPPYVSDAEYAACPRNVKDHEPATALRGGPDGLDLVRPLVADAGRWLRPGGVIALEIQYDQAETVRRLLDEAGFGDVQVRRDFEGHDRVVSGKASG